MRHLAARTLGSASLAFLPRSDDLLTLVRLLHRARTGAQLTAEGRRLLAIAQELLMQSDAFTPTLDGGEGALSGTVTLAVSQGLAECYGAPVLPALLQAHRGLTLRLVTGDEPVDLETHGIDIALRTGQAPGDAVVATPVARTARGLFASRRCADRHGLPAHPDELAGHVVLASFNAAPTVALVVVTLPRARRSARVRAVLDRRVQHAQGLTMRTVPG